MKNILVIAFFVGMTLLVQGCDCENEDSESKLPKGNYVIGQSFTIDQLRQCIANGGTRVCDLRRG